MEFYRFILIKTGGRDTPAVLHCTTLYLLRETPKGYWIRNGDTRPRWIPKESKSRFAYPTKKEALVNFQKRTLRRITLLEDQIDVCAYGLKMANNQNLIYTQSKD